MDLEELIRLTEDKDETADEIANPHWRRHHPKNMKISLI